MSDKMVVIYADSKKNRLYIIIRGKTSASEINDLEKKIFTEVKKLISGFDVVYDISDIITSDEAGKKLDDVIIKLKKSGIGNLVGIVPANKINNLVRNDYSILNASNLLAADRMLDQVQK